MTPRSRQKWVRIAPFLSSIAAVGVATFSQLQPETLHLGTALAVVVAAGSAIAPIFGISLEQVAAADEAANEAVDQGVKGLFEALTELGFNHLQFGISVFRVRRSPRPPFQLIQARIYRLRLTYNPRPTSIKWTPGKGLLGQCWAERKPVHLDHDRFYSGIGASTPREWSALPPETRQGMTFEEFQQVRAYKFVRAWPLIDERGRYRGCMVVQVDPSLRSRLFDTDVVRVVDRSLGMLASAIAKEG